MFALHHPLAQRGEIAVILAQNVRSDLTVQDQRGDIGMVRRHLAPALEPVLGAHAHQRDVLGGEGLDPDDARHSPPRPLSAAQPPLRSGNSRVWRPWRKAAPAADRAALPTSNPAFNSGFEGLNHYQQRYSRGGNQFSVEPPDQGMCVGNGYVVEVVNDVFNVHSDTTGASVLPDNTATNVVSGFARNVNHAVDLNSFYGYPPAVDRSTGVRGQFVTDPSCIYDTQTQRFFVVVLTLETV